MSCHKFHSIPFHRFISYDLSKMIIDTVELFINNYFWWWVISLFIILKVIFAVLDV